MQKTEVATGIPNHAPNLTAVSSDELESREQFERDSITRTEPFAKETTSFVPCNPQQCIPAIPNGLPQGGYIAPQAHNSSNSSNQCYCILPVPSGLPHAPYIYQCIPVTPSIASPISISAGCMNQLTPVTLIPPSQTNTGACSSPGNVCQCVPASATHTIDTVATTLTQMKSAKSADQMPLSSEASNVDRASSHNPNNDRISIAGTQSSNVKPKSRPHTCKLLDAWGHCCKRTFTRPYDLLRHQETVHGAGSKSFSCEMCGCKSKKFSRQDSLARHIRRMHQCVEPSDTQRLSRTSSPTNDLEITREGACLKDTESVTSEPSSSHSMFSPVPEHRPTATPSETISRKTNMAERAAFSREPESKRIKVEQIMTAQVV